MKISKEEINNNEETAKEEPELELCPICKAKKIKLKIEKLLIELEFRRSLHLQQELEKYELELEKIKKEKEAEIYFWINCKNHQNSNNM